ncbi:MAG: XTP/dITP diphosphatase [Desulfurococcales archaeon]|nr:XTP/dITP diphosphatase [Desulfurococcales archaeon]
MLKKGEENIRLAFITSNQHKYLEAKQILSKYNIDLYMVDLGKLEVQDEKVENISRIAAIYAYNQLRKPLIVEDSGLFIEALNGFPGPFSSFVHRTIGNEGILQLMAKESNRRAYFKASITCICDQFVMTFNGQVDGAISMKPKGDQGFGFDPIFIPNGFDKTFSELGENIKNRISHRSKAFTKFAIWISEQKPIKP